ncbi:MAG TPA: hypothetical protein VHJ34_14125 [Actinomycetota bacterium]|nr:hypothetical protein [Actinomycetota bacterium]
MFAQVIQGRATDADAVMRQMEAWDRDLKPGAEGFLGSTAGVSDDGRFFAIARFESDDAARRNSDRPEQGRWWSETERHLEDVTFHDCAQVDEWSGGGSDDAGFVQVILGRVSDVEAVRALMREMETELAGMRPDLIGGVTAWFSDDPGASCDVLYFTSEEEARRGEKEMGESADAAEAMQRMEGLVVGEPTFVDLRNPRFSSP